MAKKIKKAPVAIATSSFSDAAENYYGEAFTQEKTAKIWILITIFCFILVLPINFYFLFSEFFCGYEYEMSIFKIIPLNIFFLTAISLSAGLVRFHKKIAKEKVSEALKFLALSEITSTLAKSEVDKIKIELANSIVCSYESSNDKEEILEALKFYNFNLNKPELANKRVTAPKKTS